jgi:hypothetical protein
MDYKRALFILVFLLSGFLGTRAAEIKPLATLDSIHLLIGDQTRLHLEIEFPKGIEVGFPVPGKNLSEQVEIVERTGVDTIMLDNNRFKLSQDFIITSFDSGTHLIEPFWFQLKSNGYSDSARTSPLIVNVYNLPKIDSLIQALQGPIDIKGPYDAPVTFKEVAPWILGSLLVAGLVFLILYALRRKRNNQSIFGIPPKPKEPAHIIALRELDRIKDEKIWQQGHIKLYYSELTDAIRTYIELRFEIPALEQTSEETLAAFQFRSSLVDEQSFSNLKKLLTLADLVKFAKYEPLPDDNSLALVNAYFFVNQTKLVVSEIMVPPVTEKTSGETEVTLK